MCRTAQSPRNGIDPCAIRPWVSISAHQTPRWPMHTRSTLRGSGMMTWSTRGGGEPTALRQIMNAAVPARLFVHRARNLQYARQPAAQVDQGLDGDDGSGKPSLHVASAAAVDLTVLHHGGKWIHGPARAGLHDVDMAVEMHARSGRAAVAPRDDIEARVAIAISRSPLRAHVVEGESARLQTPPDELGAGLITLAGRIHRRKSDQRTSQFDEFVAPLIDGFEQRLGEIARHRGSSGTAPIDHGAITSRLQLNPDGASGSLRRAPAPHRPSRPNPGSHRPRRARC